MRGPAWGCGMRGGGAGKPGARGGLLATTFLGGAALLLLALLLLRDATWSIAAANQDESGQQEAHAAQGALTAQLAGGESGVVARAQEAVASEVPGRGEGGRDDSEESARRAEEVLEQWRMHVQLPYSARDAARGAAGDAESGAAGKAAGMRRAVRPMHLVDCGSLRRRHQEEHWAERPSSGELPEWAAIGDPRQAASRHPDDYRTGPKERLERLGRHRFRSGTGETAWQPGEGPLTDPHFEGPYPPWVEGSDQANYPMTRRAQRDIWVHQHPQNCSDPSVKFLYAGVGPRTKHGFGAQMNMAAGALSLALLEGRVLVLKGFDRAAHAGCQGRDYNRLSCYFLPETSEACRRRAEELAEDPRSTHGPDPQVKGWRAAHPMAYFYPPLPRFWGQPWLRIPPVVQAQGKLIRSNRMQNKYRWWRAQAMKYFMRGFTEYTCHFVNRHRHAAFGALAAMEVARAAAGTEMPAGPVGPMDDVWAHNASPWVPRPLVSMHVRMGDKGKEMEVMGVAHYVALLSQVRAYHPLAQNVWVASEMQEAIDTISSMGGWRVFATNISRIKPGQSVSMPKYEDSLGVQASAENALANLFIALDADFFIGALGSAWSYLIDALRCTSGKAQNGFLSVNISPKW